MAYIDRIDEENFMDFQMVFGVKSEGYSRSLLQMQEFRLKSLYETLRQW